MDELGKTLEASKAEMAAVTTQITQLQGEMETMSERLKSEIQSATAALAEVQEATRFVERWTSDISFISEMKALNQQLESAEQSIEEKQALVDAAQAKLNEARTAAEQAAQQKKEVESRAKSLKQKIMKLRGA